MTLVEKVEDGKGRMGGGGEGVGAGVGKGGVVGSIPASLVLLDDLPLAASFGGAVTNHLFFCCLPICVSGLHHFLNL